MKVSFLVPVYNQEELIKRCLLSTPKSYELVICDDCSTDNTRESIEQLLDTLPFEKITYLKNDRNMGVGYTMNRLYDAMTGDYYMQLDSDDYLLPEVSDVIEQLDGTDMVFFNLRVNDGTLLIPTPDNYKQSLVGHVKFVRSSFLGDTRAGDLRAAEDYELMKLLADKPHTTKFTGITAKHYNFPREDSLYNRMINNKPLQWNPLELNVFTNSTPDIRKRQTIFETIKSANDVFGKPDKLTVYYDPHPNIEDADWYLKLLQEHYKVIVTNGLADGYKKSIENSKNEYVLQLEHDWTFKNINHSYDDIVRHMKKDGLMYLRFNKFENRHTPFLDPWETHFEPKDWYCETDNISNNPHIINVEYYKKNMINKIDVTASGSYGVEQNLEARKIIGAMYGGLNYPATISHIDGAVISNPKAKILLFTNDINKIGGIETGFYNMALFLKANGYDVGVRYHKADRFQIEKFMQSGISIEHDKPESCDIVIFGSAWALSKNITAKVVAQQIHANWSDDFWGNQSYAITAIKANSPTTDVFLPVCESTVDYIKKYTDKEVYPMYNIAPAPKKIQHTSDKLVIAAFTRMTHEKGKDNYVALANRLKELGFDAELRVYTNGDAPNGWNIHEPVKDISEELCDVTFVASLSDTESFGYTIAEANSCGIPCIIKRCKSTNEFFDESSNIIIDNISEINAKMLRKKYKISYGIDKKSRKSVLDIVEKLEIIAEQRCIIKVMKNFYDMETGKNRKRYEIFSTTRTRADELLKHEANIAEEIA